MRYRFFITAGFVAIAFTSLLAKDPDASATAGGKEPSTKQNEAAGPLETAAFPNALDNLNLSDDQKKQIQRVLDTHNAEIEVVWKEFTRRYRGTLALESNLLAAIEDTLSDSQRAAVRSKRTRTARSGRESDVRSDRKGVPEQRANADDQKPGIVVEEDLMIVGVTLSPEQERAADRIHAGYFVPLRDAKRDIHRLHARLISLEFEKLAEIEKLLSAEQLAQLRKDRQAGPGESGEADSRAGSK